MAIHADICCAICQMSLQPYQCSIVDPHCLTHADWRDSFKPQVFMWSVTWSQTACSIYSKTYGRLERGLYFLTTGPSQGFWSEGSYHRIFFILRRNSLILKWQIYYLQNDWEKFRQTLFFKKCWNRIEFRWQCVRFPYDFLHANFWDKLGMSTLPFMAIEFKRLINLVHKCASYFIDFDWK